MEELTFRQAVKNIVDNLPAHIEFQVVKAELCREYYIELLNQSFTKEEALELCKTFELGK